MKETIKIACILAVSTLFCLVLWDIHKLTGKATQAIEDIDRATVIVAGAATNVEKGARAWKENSEAQAKSSTEAFQNLNRTAISANNLLTSTNNSLNSRLLPSLSQAIEEQNRALLKTQGDLQASLGGIAQATAQTQRILADVDRDITNPSIGITLHNIEDSSNHVSESTAHLARITKDGQDVADKFRNDYMKPQKFAWELLKQLIGIGGSMAQMVK